MPRAHAQAPPPALTRSPATETVVLPASVPDPIEPFNRVVWAFNKGLMIGVIKPTQWDIPRSDVDFGQTFGQWGWKPGCFIMLPVLGPSNERDALGRAADTAANPLLYISPYDFVANNPLTYLGPYTYSSSWERWRV